VAAFILGAQTAGPGRQLQLQQAPQQAQSFYCNSASHLPSSQAVQLYRNDSHSAAVQAATDTYNSVLLQQQDQLQFNAQAKRG
jgi:hypothetical protein